MNRLWILVGIITCVLLSSVYQAQRGAPPNERSGGATIHGFLYDAVTGYKINGTVTLQDLSRRRVSQVQSRDGEYRLTNIPEGTYFLHVEDFNRHVPQDYGQISPDAPPVELRISAGTLLEITFMLEPAGSISGVLKDPDGALVRNAEVQLLAVRYDTAGNRFLVAPTTVPPTRISFSGNFSFGAVPAGEYYVRAAVALPAPRPGVITPVNYNIRTYFPGVKDVEQAATIEMPRTPKQIPSVNFFFRDLSEFKITGRILLPTQHKVKEPLYVFLAPRGNLYPRVVDPPQATVDFDEAPDRFELRNVPPGLYDLYIASVTDYAPTADGAPNFPGYSARLSVEVKDKDVVDLVALLKPGVDLHGQFKLDGSSIASKVNLSGSLPVFVPQDGKPWALAPAATANPNNFVKADGAFDVIHAAEGEYRIGAVLPEDLYLAEAWLGPRHILGQRFEIDAKTEDALILELRSDGARFEGIVTDSDNNKANVLVVLVPPSEFREDPGTSKSVKTDKEGHFTISGIRPGLYTVYAFPRIPNNAWLNDEFMGEYRAHGMQINFAKGTQVYREFKSVPMPK